MFKALCQRFTGLASAFLAVQKGSILIYSGAFMSIGVGGAAVSIDIGRVVLLRTQMQNRADAGALAGAAQLDADNNAMWRSEKAVRDSMNAWTTSGAETNVIQVSSVLFYNSDAVTYTTPDTVTPPTDELSRFVDVRLVQIVLSFFYAPAQNLLNGGSADPQMTLNARAMAMSDPYICKAQPMMICDPFDNGDGTSSQDMLADTHAGKSIVLSPSTGGGGGSLVAGNFGFLALPEDVNYTGGGATVIQKALQEEDPQGCYGVNTLTTSTGAMTGPVSDGINVRFDDPNPKMTQPLPSPNIMAYAKDSPNFEVAGYELLGDGGWDFAGYWSTNHPGVTVPPALSGTPSRYTVYLYELDVNFWTKNGGKNALALVDDDAPGGYTLKDPSADEASAGITGAAVVPAAGVPTYTPSTQGYARRLMRLALVRCTGLTGSSVEIQNPSRYVEIFITQPMGSGPGSGIYGEIVRKLVPQTSLEFHGNVRLVL